MGKKKVPVWPHKKKGDIGIREIKKEIEALSEEIAKKEAAKEAEKKPPDGEPEELDSDNAWAYMLKDMRSAYKSAGGRKKLLGLIKADDKLLMAMVKELMKVEASLMATEMRNKNVEAGERPVTFVILKGLYTDKEVDKMVDKMVDIDQVTDAINPLSQPKLEYEEEMERPE